MPVCILRTREYLWFKVKVIHFWCVECLNVAMVVCYSLSMKVISSVVLALILTLLNLVKIANISKLYYITNKDQ